MYSVTKNSYLQIVAKCKMSVKDFQILDMLLPTKLPFDGNLITIILRYTPLMMN